MSAELPTKKPVPEVLAMESNSGTLPMASGTPPPFGLP